MAILAEELVEEWLNRQGFFTIRGVKLGVQEIDLLGIRMTSGAPECRHVEVQASIHPVNGLFAYTKEDQKRLGVGGSSQRSKSDDERRRACLAWIGKKFDHPAKVALRSKLAPGEWTRELVVHHVQDSKDLDLLREYGIILHPLKEVLASMRTQPHVVPRASGADLGDLTCLSIRDTG